MYKKPRTKTFIYYLSVSSKPSMDVKGTNHFLNKIKKLRSLPDEAILCTMDVAGLTLIYHMGKVLRLSVGFWQLGITNKSQVIP